MPKIFIPVVLLFLVSCGTKESNVQETKTGEQTKTPKTDLRMENALSFINAYIQNCNKMGDAVPVVDWVQSNPLATDRFKADLKKMVDDAYAEDSLLGPDADPLLNAQDYPPNGFEAGSIDNDNYVTLNGTDQTGFKVVLKMVNQNTNWLVDGCGMVNIPTDK